MARKHRSLFRKALDIIEDLETEERLERGGALSFRAFLESDDFARPALRESGGAELSEAIGAIVDASEGTPVTCSLDVCHKLFRCDPEQLPREARKVIAIGAGGRAGKTSRLLAPKAVHAAWTVNIPNVMPGEPAIALIVAPKKKLAKKTFSIVLGIIDKSPVLRKAIVGEPRSLDITLRRPDGKLVSIEVGVADEHGEDARGSPLVALLLDEAAFFKTKGGDEGPDQAIIDAAKVRLVPGAQIWIVSTPWIEGIGALERIIAKDWGKHEGALVAARVDTRTLNPSWDRDHAIENDIRRGPNGDIKAQLEIWAQPLPKGTRAMFPPAVVEQCLNAKAPRNVLVAAIGAGADTGFVKDASSLAIVKRFVNGVFAPIEFVKKRPDPTRNIRLVPSEVFEEFATVACDHGCSSVASDINYQEAFREALSERGLALISVPSSKKTDMYIATLEIMRRAHLALGDLKSEDRDDLRDQFLSITTRPIPGDGDRFEVVAPRRSIADLESHGGAAHADDVSALVAALWNAGIGTGKPKVENDVDDFDDALDVLDDEDEPRGGRSGAVGWG